jgi:hypothetical protein
MRDEIDPILICPTSGSKAAMGVIKAPLVDSS